MLQLAVALLRAASAAPACVKGSSKGSAKRGSPRSRWEPPVFVPWHSSEAGRRLQGRGRTAEITLREITNKQGVSMPRYEFLCEKCKTPFELTMTISEREKSTPKCPTCKGTKVVHNSAGSWRRPRRRADRQPGGRKDHVNIRLRLSPDRPKVRA